MPDRLLPIFLCFLALLAGIETSRAQQAAVDTPPAAGGANASAGDQKGATPKQAPASDTPAESSVCTVRPSADANKAGGAATAGDSAKNGASGASVEVNQYAGAQAAAGQQKKPQNGGGTAEDKASLPEIWILSAESPLPDGTIALPAHTINAAEIAPQLSILSPRILKATAVSSSKIVLIVNTKPASGAAGAKLKNSELDDLRLRLKQLAAQLAFAPVNAFPAESGVGPYVFSVVLPPGTGKACDIAHALVNAFSYVNEITAVDDTRLLISVADSAPDIRIVRANLTNLAKELSNPVTAASPKVETVVQRLYYNHDPKAVATIIADAYPNVAAQALPPDVVVLSDRADIDDHVRTQVLRSAQRTIARIDQPHPQVSIDAWSLQLSAKDPDDLGALIPRLEDLAGGYNQAINESLGKGWTYLSNRLADPLSLDPLMSHYLTWTTRVSNHGKDTKIERVEAPYSAKLATASHENGYGLGYATLYYPLTPNLIDMLVTLVSLSDPHTAANDMLGAMGTPSHPESRNTCREDDEASYNQQIHDDDDKRKDQVQTLRSDKSRSKEWKPTPAHPQNLHLECVRRAIVEDLLGPAPSEGETLATSNLGQLRAALVDFLFHYKLMMQYPDEFHFYDEPVAADTLDSALAPIVTAFDEDLSVFQASLQTQIADTIKREKKDIKYGYGGLVSLKILSTEPGKVSTATQNYFDATPPATLNDLLANIQAQGAAQTPLSSSVTSLAPAKTVELLTALGQTLTPKPTTAHLGRGLDLEVTAHTLSGAIGAELDLKVQSTENGAGLIQAGGKSTDDLNSRVSQHSVDTHVRVDSINLFRISTLSSTLVRGQEPWRPFDPIEVPVLSLLVKVPKSPQLVHTQSLVFVDAIIVPTAADLGYGVPVNSDERQMGSGAYGKLSSLNDFPGGFGNKLLQYHQKIVDCLNREYINHEGQVEVLIDKDKEPACARSDFQFDSPLSYDSVDER